MLAQLITSLMYVDLPVAHRRAMKRPQTTIPVCIGHKQTITFGLGWAADTSVPNSPGNRDHATVDCESVHLIAPRFLISARQLAKKKQLRSMETSSCVFVPWTRSKEF